MLFKIQRHSDHHENAKRPYQALCSYEESPQLPHGYGLSLNIALQPKLWFEMMDPLVEVYTSGGKPSDELLEACDRIARKAMWKNAVQMTVLLGLGLVL